MFRFIGMNWTEQKKKRNGLLIYMIERGLTEVDRIWQSNQSKGEKPYDQCQDDLTESGAQIGVKREYR
jgi:hypothetical protein